MDISELNQAGQATPQRKSSSSGSKKSKIQQQAEEIARLKVELTKVTAERDELKLTRMGDHRGCTDEDCQCLTCVNDHYDCCDVSNHNKSCVLNNCPDYEAEAL